jgi:putative transferase (TIGR04331 family)
VVSRFLVTTALEETWPAVDVPVLFLGEWCKLYDRKSAWGSRDAVVAPYHWDDREKLRNDYLYLQALYEELLSELTMKLNELHGVDHSVRYWRIIIGPWLGYFTQMVFDRWVMLQEVAQQYDISGANVLQRCSEQFIPNNMDEFVSLLLSDEWNESIYGQLLEQSRIFVKKVTPRSELLASANHSLKLGYRYKLKRILGGIADQLSSVLYRDDEYFFLATYLSRTKNLLLQMKLGQLPKFWRQIQPPCAVVNHTMRQWQLSSPKLSGLAADFAAIARNMIPKHIPTVYLEGYQKSLAQCKNLPWPKNPKAIFTSNSYSSDDIFKLWAAEHAENGTPLIIGQHGGNYGMALWGFTEDHQIAIADYYLSWGWSEQEQKKIIPLGNFKEFGKKATANKLGVALLVTMALPRHSYYMYSVPVAAGQWQSYFDDQCRFVQALPEGLRDQLLIRLFPQDWGYCQKQRWQERFPDIQLDEGVQPMTSLMKNTRLYISTYNATTYLESMSLNFPTLMFWNPKQWELRDSALPFFEKLKSVGIFHDTPESAARQMDKVWNDVDGWWQSEKVQSVRREFCERYAHISDNTLVLMRDVFLDVVCKNNNVIEASG